MNQYELMGTLKTRLTPIYLNIIIDNCPTLSSLKLKDSKESLEFNYGLIETFKSKAKQRPKSDYKLWLNSEYVESNRHLLSDIPPN